MTEAQLADWHLFVDRTALSSLQGLPPCPTCGAHCPADSVRDDGIPYCAICYTLLEEPV